MLVFLLSVHCFNSLFWFFFCNVCFLRKEIKCILILKKKSWPDQICFAQWLDQPSLPDVTSVLCFTHSVCLSINVLIFTEFSFQSWVWYCWRPQDVNYPRVLGPCYKRQIRLRTRQRLLWSTDHQKPQTISKLVTRRSSADHVRLSSFWWEKKLNCYCDRGNVIKAFIRRQSGGFLAAIQISPGCVQDTPEPTSPLF